jgi:hypothetical protein
MPENAQQKPTWKPQSPFYRKLLMEKFVAETDREKVLTSIIVAMAENIDRVALAIDRLGTQDEEIAIGLQAVAEHVFGGAASPGVVPEAADEGGPRDSTPFPAGAATAPPPGNKTGPMDVEEDLTPNAGSNPVANAAPIPKSAPQMKKGPNGAKVQQ